MNPDKRVSSGAHHHPFPLDTKPISNESDAGQAVGNSLFLLVRALDDTTRHTFTLLVKILFFFFKERDSRQKKRIEGKKVG